MPKMLKIADTAIASLMKQGQFDANILQEIRSIVQKLRPSK
jgi:hypothetical protein